MNQQNREARCLALHHLVADKIRRNPQLFLKAQAMIGHWLRLIVIGPPGSLYDWRDLLSQGMEPALQTACEESERGRQLRQYSPLLVLLDDKELRDFLAAWRRRH